MRFLGPCYFCILTAHFSIPKDIALVGEFTVKGAVYYFGKILNMKEEVIEERFQKLSKLLELPPDDR